MNRQLFFILTFLILFMSSCDKRVNRLRQKNLNGARVALLSSSMQEHRVKELWPQGIYNSYSTNDSSLNALANGDVDAVYTDMLVMYNKYFRKDQFELAFIDNDRMPIAGGFRKSDAKLADDFAGFLRKIKSNGEYVRIRNRWIMTDDIESVVPPAIPDYDKRAKLKTLRIGIIGEMRPYSILKNGEWTGFENELWTHFASYMGFRIQYEVMEFNNLIPALLNHKIDVIAAAMTVTEKRKRQILFSQPYAYSCSICLISKNSVRRD